MTEYINKNDAIAILEEGQKATCPVGRWGRSYANDVEAYDDWDELIDAVNALPVLEVPDVT